MKAKKRTQSQRRAGSRRAIMVKVDNEIRNELEVLALSRGETVQDLGVEAICDLLRKHGRPVNLMDALKKSAGRRKSPPRKRAVGRSRKSS